MPKVKILRPVNLVILINGEKFEKTCMPKEIVEIEEINNKDIAMNLYKPIIPQLITNKQDTNNNEEIKSVVESLKKSIEAATQILNNLTKPTNNEFEVDEDECVDEFLYTQEALNIKNNRIKSIISGNINDGEHSVKIDSIKSKLPKFAIANGNNIEFKNTLHLEKINEGTGEDILDKTPVELINMVDEKGNTKLDVFRTLGAMVASK